MEKHWHNNVNPKTVYRIVFRKNAKFLSLVEIKNWIIRISEHVTCACAIQAFTTKTEG